ncbi:hypothetical protein WJX72_009133 [[Myrmecia] bisecta]|uniref:Uncharacterized protein n=1 Tax=[Myrmecia] bisecta TaxID=41462 RepID=A0AAW1R8P5_9CHLO
MAEALGKPTSQADPGKAAALLADTDEARKEALRKAGEEYFKKVLAQASKGQDPFVPPTVTSSSSGEVPCRKRAKDIEAVDPDLETVGLVLEGVRLHVIRLLFVAAAICSFVLIEEALIPLQTPGIQVFLHLLPTVTGLWFFTDVGPITAATFRGSLPAACLAGAQMLALFGALLYGSVFLVLATTVLTPQVLLVSQQLVVERQRPGLLRLLAVLVGGAAAATALLTGRLPDPLALLCLIGWTSCEAGDLAWQAIKAGPPSPAAAAEQPARGPTLLDQLHSLVPAEAKVNAPTLAFYKSSLPAFPVLIIGFLCREGVELVNHELSVPAVTMMLLSCLAWAVLTITGVLLADTHSAGARSFMLACTAIGTLTLQALMKGVGSVVPISCALVAILSALAAHLAGAVRR